MLEFLKSIGGIIGGLGLFLLAVNMITDGLRLAAGNLLRDLLWRWTNTPARGLLSGLAITAIVQSSSAVTVATIGFVNAGFLSLSQSLGVVFGANLGTTMTGWLVAAVGFQIKVEVFALPLIGVGMLLRLAGSSRRLGAVGEALTGFGLFFIGIQVLGNSFQGLMDETQLTSLTTEGISGVLLFLLSGFVMTALTQSSSAAIAIILTAASGGVMSLTSAAAMVIGANVGTTTTAALAVVGATPNARRVAMAHILFNVVTAVLALALLPIMLWLVRETSGMLGLEDIPAVILALFHSAFNLLGVMVMWPLAGTLAAFLEQRFVTAEEIQSRPRYLDKTVLLSPMLALDALLLELKRVSALVCAMGLNTLGAQAGNSRSVRAEHQALDTLLAAIGDFIARLESDKLTKDVSERLPNILRAVQYYAVCAEIIQAIDEAETGISPVYDAALAASITAFTARMAAFLRSTDINAEDFTLGNNDQHLQEVEAAYHALKANILQAGVQGRVNLPDMSHLLEQISRMRRLANQYLKGNRYLKDLDEFVTTFTRQEVQPSAAEKNPQPTQHDVSSGE